jgi:hypothetical protein
MIAVEKVVLLVVVSNVLWLLVGWQMGYKEGKKDWFARGRAAGVAWATERVRNS